MNWTTSKIDDRTSDERIEHESEAERESHAKTLATLEASQKMNVEVIRRPTVKRPKADMVNHPPHYTAGGIETIDFIKAKLTPEEFIGYLKGNIIKYTSRAGKKDDLVQDIEKSQWYSNKLVSTLKGETK
jgi:hypothetical protein